MYQRIYDLESEGLTATIPNVNLAGSVLPNYMEDHLDRSESNFWHYKGSLTTPGCYEYVQWHVMDYKAKITNLQLTTLRSINGSHGKLTQNWRPIQDNINTVYEFDFESIESSSSNKNDETTDGTDTELSDDDDASAAAANFMDSEEFDKLSENDEEILDTVLALLIIVVIFCLLWMAYSINETRNAPPKSYAATADASMKEISIRNRGATPEKN